MLVLIFIEFRLVIGEDHLVDDIVLLIQLHYEIKPYETFLAGTILWNGLAICSNSCGLWINFLSAWASMLIWHAFIYFILDEMLMGLLGFEFLKHELFIRHLLLLVTHLILGCEGSASSSIDSKIVNLDLCFIDLVFLCCFDIRNRISSINAIEGILVHQAHVQLWWAPL